VRVVKLYISTFLTVVFITAVFSSFLTNAYRIVGATTQTETKVKVLETYYNIASNVPFSNSGRENFQESNTFELKTNDFKTNFLLRILSHTQLCFNKFDNSNFFFLESIAQKKFDGYYLFNLCKLLI